jgi:hypothetical protein
MQQHHLSGGRKSRDFESSRVDVESSRVDVESVGGSFELAGRSRQEEKATPAGARCVGHTSCLGCFSPWGMGTSVDPPRLLKWKS